MTPRRPHIARKQVKDRLPRHGVCLSGEGLLARWVGRYHTRGIAFPCTQQWNSTIPHGIPHGIGIPYGIPIPHGIPSIPYGIPQFHMEFHNSPHGIPIVGRNTSTFESDCE